MRYLLFGCIALFFIGCHKTVFKLKWTAEKSPPTYTVRFETTRGKFDVQVQREWSPLAADRFYQLVKHKFYDSAIFYRVVPNFVAQFASKDWAISQKWNHFKIADEPVKHGNNKGSLSFARSGRETRGDALFINLKDNTRLDTLYNKGVVGYPSFGEIVNGLEVVTALYSGYDEKPRTQDTMRYINRQEFFRLFPKLDVIKKAYILRKKT